MQDSIVPSKPQISDETMKEIAKFFMQTSIPRIIEKMKKEGDKNGNHAELHFR